MYFSYILRSEKTGRHYYGHTKDLEKRLKAHNQGKVRSTKNGRPWEIVHKEKYATKSEAYTRERYFKSIEGYQFLKSKGIL